MSSNTKKPVSTKKAVKVSNQFTVSVPNLPDVLKPKPAKSSSVKKTSDPKKSKSNLSSTEKDKLILERLKLENSQIDDYIQILNNQRKTDRSSMDYDSYYYNLLDNIYTPLFILYLLSVIGLGYFLFMMENDYSLSTKIAFMTVFMIYPFIIEFLEDLIISWLNYFYSMIRFTPSGTNPIKTATESQPFLFSQRYNVKDMSIY